MTSGSRFSNWSSQSFNNPAVLTAVCEKEEEKTWINQTTTLVLPGVCAAEETETTLDVGLVVYEEITGD